MIALRAENHRDGDVSRHGQCRAHNIDVKSCCRIRTVCPVYWRWVA